MKTSRDVHFAKKNVLSKFVGKMHVNLSEYTRPKHFFLLIRIVYYVLDLSDLRHFLLDHFFDIGEINYYYTPIIDFQY